jgi:ketosteroid isomerase-like protein
MHPHRLRILLGVFGVVAVILISTKLRGRASENNKESLLAIDALVRDQVEAWNGGDVDGYLAAAVEGDDFRLYAGKDLLKGKAAGQEWFRKRFQANGTPGELTLADVSIELLGPDSACVAGRWHRETADTHDRDGVFTLILKKQRAGWRIAYEHFSVGN